MRRSCSNIFFAAILICVTSTLVFSQRTELKPGRYNLFSPQQDVELGQQVAQDAERQIPMLNNSRVDDYLNRLGSRLAANAPGEKYPYNFKCVNDSSINAFALPGGFLYVNRGVIEAADNEAELAGVISHEIGHVALRHGTNLATKQYVAQVPLAILGGALGRNSVGSVIAQTGANLFTNTILLKYSRDDERQADVMGAQILYDSNYDPRYLATFFDKLGTGGRGFEPLSSHPNPESRIQSINAEIAKLGARSNRASNDSNEFQSIKRYVTSLPAAPAERTSRNGSQSRSEDTRWEGRPERPSARYREFEVDIVSVRHPDNWESYGESQGFTLAPRGGIVESGGSEALAYGAIMSVYALDSGSRAGLRQATDELVRELQSPNTSMRLSRDQGQIRVGGQAALSRLFTNDSPLGGREINWLVTSLRPEGLVYFIFVAPEQEFRDYQRAFQQILDSVYYR